MTSSREQWTTEVFGGVEVYRPTSAIDEYFRVRAQEHLRAEYDSGEYRDPDVINAILHRLFGFYNDQFEESMKSIASRDTIQLVLYEYDQAAKIKNRLDKGLLAAQERDRWQFLGPTFRRAAKYFAERLTATATLPAPDLPRRHRWEMLGRCWACCEELIALSIVSTQTFALFPEDTTLVIYPPSNGVFVDLTLSDSVVSRLDFHAHRQEQETRLREKYIDQKALIFNNSRASTHLDSSFRDQLGFTIDQAWGLLSHLAETALPPVDGGFPIPFVAEDQILANFQDTLKIGEEQAKRLLDGATLRAENMASEGRVIWKPKQQHRAATRPFFEFPHETGPHVVWSKEMARECMLMLWIDLAFKRIPAEWATLEISSHVAQYSTSINRDFERNVIDDFRKVGIHARSFRKQIGSSDAAVRIPDSVGDIDVLAYLEGEETLIVGDSKMVKFTVEPGTFRDDLDKFIGSGGNYVEQIKRKHAWVRDNLQAVARALESDSAFPNSVWIKSTSPLIVTYFPTIASCFVDELPCVSITEVMEDFQAAGRWPYKTHDVSP